MTTQVFDGATEDLTCAMRPYRWLDAGLSSGNNFVVLQVGSKLHLWREPKSGALGEFDYEIDLFAHVCTSFDPFLNSTTQSTIADVQGASVDFSQVNGKLVVVGKHIEPLIIQWDASTELFETTELILKERDLFGIDDGTPMNVQPPTPMTNAHEYNLVNRGWSTENIDAYFDDIGLYPSKNMLHFMGMRRQVDGVVADEDATKQFVPAAIEAELFQDMSAPQGHNIREIFNRRNNFTSTLSDLTVVTMKNTAASAVYAGSDLWTVTITTPAVHGMTTGSLVTIMALELKWKKSNGDKIKRRYTGSYEVIDAPTTSTFRISVAGSGNWTYYSTPLAGWSADQSNMTGSVFNEDDSAIPIFTRFSCVATYAARVFYSGCIDDRISNRVYFSKLVEQDTDLSICHQETDPTSEFLSDLVATDGGYVTLPEAGFIHSLLVYQSYLLVFSSAGVWAIGPGKDGTFGATGYSLTKLGDVGCISPRSIVIAGDTPMYWAEDGIYAIVPDEQSGRLHSTNVSQNVINGLFSSIRYQEKTRVKAVYDSVRKRVMWLYNNRLVTPTSIDAPATGEDMLQTTPVTAIGTLDDTDTEEIWYNACIIFDLRLGAWTRWVFGDAAAFRVREIFCMPASYVTDNDLRLKVICQKYVGTGTDLQTFKTCEFNDYTTYADNGAEAAAFVYSGPDSMAEPERMKYAPYVHVFMRRQTNASLKMQPRWDWARGHTSGKIGNYQQVYREMRPIPEAYGLVVTKNKVPGRGRNLFLAFACEAGKDAWIDGWTVKYDAQMRI